LDIDHSFTCRSETNEGLLHTFLAACAPQLERFQAKWTPVRVKKTRQNKKLEPRSDQSERKRL